MTPAKPTDHRRWRQYRLRSALLLVLVCAAASAWLRQRELERLEREARQLRADRAEAIAQFQSQGAELKLATASSAPDASAAASPASQTTRLVALAFGRPIEAHAWKYNRYRGGCRLGMGEGYPIGWTYTSLPRVGLFPELERLSVNSRAVLPDAELRCLRNLPQLKELRLRGPLTERGCRKLAGVAQLRQLWLRHANLSGGALRHLRGMQQLEDLDLSDCQLTDGELVHLSTLRSLQSLDLSHNSITDAGLQHLAELRNLHSLRLAGTGVTSEGLGVLCDVKQLRRLDLSWTEVVDLQPLTRLPALQLVVFQGSNLSDESEEAFRAARPSVFVERNYGEHHGTREGSFDWLGRHQQADGRWRLFEAAEDVDDAVRGTALALLVYVADGRPPTYTSQLPDDVRDRGVLRRGLDWLLSRQDEQGRFGQRGAPGRRLETQAIAVLTLNEVGWMSKDDRVIDAARRGARALAADWLALDVRGAFERGELSGTGWVAMAFASAVSGAVPEAATAKLLRLLDELALEGGSRYGYDGRTPDPCLTAEALVARRLFGWSSRDPRLTRGIAYLLQDLPDAGDDPRYVFFGAQALYRVPGDAFDTWNLSLRAVLEDQQCLHGRQRGSYPPSPAASTRGRLETTCLTTLAGLVYYRYLILWQQR